MSGAAAAAAAAARRRRLLEQGEEEEMTNYAADALANDWEFKIVRRQHHGVPEPARALARLLEQEAQAGWTMVEKFDDMRVRFKRPRQARLGDAQLPPASTRIERTTECRRAPSPP
jgi:hypothetical protein